MSGRIDLAAIADACQDFLDTWQDDHAPAEALGHPLWALKRAVEGDVS